ncbi:DUF6236 family protein [Micromonospora haikouensis]|uniref:Uncharacterized protein n=1 Tax=Micromonospora haikouensis TaxID=686309 RepID=A0A0D0V3D8_9ACTN|nr:DUF6236 family protein [Micromonospora haikouensis]KIR65467.1 hypothetical protein TK50_08655 [Micromonospora haikouensis]
MQINDIGLYYPYFHVRDDTWLKAAALYLPQVARIRPPGYPVRDSETANVLRAELDFLLDVDPGPQAASTAREFGELVQQDTEALERYLLPDYPGGGGFGIEVDNPWFQDEARFAWIHASQLGDNRAFIELLRDRGLATMTRFDPLTGIRDDAQWVGMHPRLVAVYSCALAQRISRANQLLPVTHDLRLFALPEDWTVQELGAALVNTRPPGASSSSSSVLYAGAALQSVLPAGLEHVPAQDIVRARRTLAAEFDAFRVHLTGLAEEFARLDGIEDPEILRARLAAMVELDLRSSVRELEQGLRALRMEPIRAMFGLKSLELPTVAALAAHALNFSPMIGAGGLLAVQAFTAVRAARKSAGERRSSAAGYLLGLRAQLDPPSALERARRIVTGRG